MPTNRSTDGAQTADTKPDADTPPDQPAPQETAEETAPEQPQVFEYVAPFDTVYPSVPLTARAARPAVPATKNDAAVPATPATVFAWPDGAPDNRWQPSTKQPNQRPDNEPAQPTEA